MKPEIAVRRHRSNGQRGMSMVELMIAMALGLMLTIGIGSLFMQTRTSFAQDEQIATMQSNLRFAMESLVRDITMTGFWGSIVDPVAINPDTDLDIGTDCGAGWAYGIQNPLAGVNNATPGQANSNFPCITSGHFEAGTDIIAIKRVVANPVPETDLVNNRVYIGENGVNGLLFKHPESGGMSIDGDVTNRLYTPMIYYIRNHSVTADDGIPTLCRKLLRVIDGMPSITEECLVEGIEQLQLEYGIDTNDSGTANRYVSAPAAGDFNRVTTIRIHLLARSLRAQSGYDNEKTYVIGDLTYTPDDSFYRRAATTTVVLRNPNNLRNLGN